MKQQYQITPLTILLYQPYINRYITKLELEYQSKISNYHSEQVKVPHLQINKQNYHIRIQSQAQDEEYADFREYPLSARNISQVHSTPRQFNFTPRPDKLMTKNIHKNDNFDKYNEIPQIENDQSDLLTIILQLQDKVKQQDEEIDKFKAELQSLKNTK